MKILFLTDITTQTGSWIGRYRPLLETLASRGHRVTVFLPYDRENSKKPDGKHSLNIHYVGRTLRKGNGQLRQTHGSLKLLTQALKNLFQLLQRGLREEFDLVFVGKPLPVAATAGALLSGIRRARLHLDCDDREIHTNQLTSGIQFQTVRFFENYFPRVCHLVTTHNLFLRQRIASFKGSSDMLFYIPNGIETRRLMLSNQNITCKAPMPGRPTVLYFGDLNRSTGHSVDLLIKSLPVLTDLVKNIRLVIVGDGVDDAYLKSLADRLGVTANVEWVGRVKPDEVGLFIRHCDLVVDPVSVHPGNLSRCPLKILEAMYFGKPVVTSDMGDRKNIMGEYGVYAKVGDPVDLAIKITGLLENRQKSKKMGEGLQKLTGQYTWPLLADRFEDIWKKVGVLT